MARAIDGHKGRPGAFRRGLMLYGSTAALAAALMLAEGGVGPALAQDIGPRMSPTTAAQGDFIGSNINPGPAPSPSFEFRSGTLDIVQMNGDAILNWSTYDTAAPGGAQGNSYVNFLPADTELRFVGNGGSFTAINRVFTVADNAGNYRGIAFQGQVTSYLFGDGPKSVGPVGGNIWFFSPGGILATGSASFSVGSLLLSASDLDNFVEFGNARSVDFTGVANPFASVILQQGARVTLTQPNSSFAIVAPTIEQGGDVFVNGSVSYLSGETGNLYFYSTGEIGAGIFEPSQAGNEIRHLGTTSGPASIATDNFSVFDPQTIEFRSGEDVGVLLSGSIGYAPATDAALGPNGSIRLTAGSITSAGDLTLSSSGFLDAAAVNLTAAAGQTIGAGSDANGPYNFTVRSQDTMLLAAAGGVVDFAGNLVIGSADEGARHRIGAAAAGNNAPGGLVQVGGDLLVDSSLLAFSGGSQRGGEIEVTIGDGGAIAVGGRMVLSSDGSATEDDFGTSAFGGRAVLTMTGANASLTVGGDLTISAQARPFFQNCECFQPPSGSGTGGYAAFTATGGMIEAGALNVSASAEAFSSFYGEAGADLDATGGTALVSLGDSAAAFESIGVYAEAQGASAPQGPDGGDALGGSASFSKGAGGSLATQGIVVSADASGGEGGNPNGDGLLATRGGNAAGGTASIVLAQNADGLGYLDLSARARAGNGGEGTEYSAENGADGGNALGGAATLTLSGEGTNLAGVLEGSLDVSADAGSGGDGEADFSNGVQSGDGGLGGSARGGSLTITAADGAEFSWGLNFQLGANGGAGGKGGNQARNELGPSTIGQGGRGGDAVGATVAIVADGGLISGDLDLDVQGQAGAGGLDGFDLDGNFTGRGDFGLTTGGSIALTALDNGPSRFEVGSATLNTSGNTAGLVAITDQSTDPQAAMRFGSLAAYGYGEPAGVTPGFSLSAMANPVVVDGTAEIYAHSIAFAFSGSGRMEVGGAAFLSTQNGDLTISHADNPGVLSLHASGAVEVYANGNYLAGAGSVVASGDSTSIRTSGSISASDTSSLGNVFMSAQGDTSVGNVTAGGNVDLFAGRLEFDGAFAFSPSASATVTGTVTAGASVSVTSGGFAEFASGSQVLSDNDITVRTGDDIIVASGASLVSDIDPDNFVSLRLLAGDINFGQSDGDLIEPIGTPIASLRVAGDLDTNGASLYLSGDAIDASASTISTGNLFVDVTDAPPFGPFSNDGGLLGDLCRQGNACLGSIAATGTVEIGLDSNNGLISLRTGAIDFSGDNFEVETIERLELNVDNLPSSLVAGELISLRSVNDVVALTGVTLEAPSLSLRAGTDLAAGTATLIGSGSVQIEVGNDLIAGTIIAANGLDDGSDSGGPFSAPGDFIVGSLTYGGGADMLIRAGRNLSLGSGDPNGGAIDLRAGEALFLGSTATGSGAIRLDGESVSFNNLRSLGTVYVTAGEGGISGIAELPRAIDTAAGIALETSGDVSVSDLFAGTDIAISGATVSAAALTAGGSLAATAAGAGSVGSFSSGGYAVFTGASFDLGTGSAGSFLAVQATDGDISFVDLGAAGAGTLQASGALLGGDVAAGGALSLSGGSLAIDSAAGADVRATAAGALSLRSVDASQSVELIGASVAFTSIAAGSGAAIESSGAIDGGSIEAGTFAAIVAADAIALTGLSAGTATIESRSGAVSASGVAVSGVLAASGTAVTLAAPGALEVAASASAGNIGITAGGDLRVDASATGDIALASTGGSVFVGSVAQLDGTFGGIGAEAVSGGGAVSVTAAQGISVADSLSAEGALTMDAGGLVSLAGSASGQTIDLRAGDLAIGTSGALGSASTQRISLSSSAAVNLGTGADSGFAIDATEFARIQSGGDLMVTALAGTGGGAGSLTVGSLTVNAGSGGQVGASGTFGLTASGLLDVNSTLSIAGAGSGNTLMLTGDAVDLDYANAQLSVLDSANASTGRIIVNGRLITSMSAAAASDIAGKTTAEIDVRLGQADAVREIGLFRTADLILEGREAILIQNSGGSVADERRGLNAGTLTVTGAADGRMLVVINGIVGNATGIAAAQNVTVTTPIASGSTVNGCALANIAACFAIAEPEPLITPPESILFGTTDLIKDEKAEDEVEDGVADGKSEAPPLDTTRIDDPAGLPMIDDPVTGAGNEDLWQPPDE